jgi:hypothetical protein
VSCNTHSDYTAFIHHLGITSLDLRAAIEPEYGVYHSIYDSFSWMENFGDRCDGRTDGVDGWMDR